MIVIFLVFEKIPRAAGYGEHGVYGGGIRGGRPNVGSDRGGQTFDAHGRPFMQLTPARSRSLEKAPDLDPLFDDLTCAKSAKELKEHLETRVL